MKKLLFYILILGLGGISSTQAVDNGKYISHILNRWGESHPKDSVYLISFSSKADLKVRKGYKLIAGPLRGEIYSVNPNFLQINPTWPDKPEPVFFSVAEDMAGLLVVIGKTAHEFRISDDIPHKDNLLIIEKDGTVRFEKA